MAQVHFKDTFTNITIYRRHLDYLQKNNGFFINPQQHNTTQRNTKQILQRKKLDTSSSVLESQDISKHSLPFSIKTFLRYTRHPSHRRFPFSKHIYKTSDHSKFQFQSKHFQVCFYREIIRLLAIRDIRPFSVFRSPIPISIKTESSRHPSHLHFQDLDMSSDNFKFQFQSKYLNA